MKKFHTQRPLVVNSLYNPATFDIKRKGWYGFPRIHNEGNHHAVCAVRLVGRVGLCRAVRLLQPICRAVVGFGEKATQRVAGGVLVSLHGRRVRQLAVFYPPGPIAVDSSGNIEHGHIWQELANLVQTTNQSPGLAFRIAGSTAGHRA